MSNPDIILTCVTLIRILIKIRWYLNYCFQDLLFDFEGQIEDSETMEAQLKQLKARHAELKKENQMYKKKIEKHKKAKDDSIPY